MGSTHSTEGNYIVKLIKSSREKYKTMQAGSIRNDVRKVHMFSFQKFDFHVKCKKLVIVKYRERIWEVQMFSL
jgi:hypothetical protein